MHHPIIARLLVEDHVDNLYREAQAERLAKMARMPSESMTSRWGSAVGAARQAAAPSTSPLGGTRIAPEN